MTAFRLLIIALLAMLLSSCRTSDSDFGIEKLGLQEPLPHGTPAASC